MDVIGLTIDGSCIDLNADTSGVVGFWCGAFNSIGIPQADLDNIATRLRGAGILDISFFHQGTSEKYCGL